MEDLTLTLPNGIRTTTMEAYILARDSGLLSKLRLRVFEVICKYGPLTMNESRKYLGMNANSGTYCTRFSELEKMKLIQGIDIRPCKTTGRRAIVWEVTGNSPIKLPKIKSKKNCKDDVIKRLNEISRYMNDIFLQKEIEDISSLIKNNL